METAPNRVHPAKLDAERHLSESDDPSVSVVIPTCDRPDLLRRAVDSVVRQSVRPLELLVVDDGSGETEACRLPHSTDFAIKVVATGGYRGVGHARNLGAAAAQGTYVAFLDDDDWWHEDFLLHTFRTIQRAGADFVAAAWFSVRPDQGVRPGKVTPAAWRVDQWLTANPGVTGSNFLISRDLFCEVGGFDERLPPCEDRDLVIRLIQQGARFASVETPLMYRYLHSGQRITNFSRRRLLSTFLFFRKHRHLLSARAYRRHRAARFLDAASYYRETRGEWRGRYIIRAMMSDPKLLLGRILRASAVRVKR